MILKNKEVKIYNETLVTYLRIQSWYVPGHTG